MTMINDSFKKNQQQQKTVFQYAAFYVADPARRPLPAMTFFTISHHVGQSISVYD